jgi:hypothetical protein
MLNLAPYSRTHPRPPLRACHPVTEGGHNEPVTLSDSPSWVQAVDNEPVTLSLARAGHNEPVTLSPHNQPRHRTQRPDRSNLLVTCEIADHPSSLPVMGGAPFCHSRDIKMEFQTCAEVLRVRLDSTNGSMTTPSCQWRNGSGGKLPVLFSPKFTPPRTNRPVGNRQSGSRPQAGVAGGRGGTTAAPSAAPGGTPSLTSCSRV